MRRNRVGPHGVRGRGRGTDAGSGVVVRRQFRGTVLVLRRELHSGVRITHGAHAAAGSAAAAAGDDPVGNRGNRSGGAAAGRRAPVQRRAAAARA